LEPEVEIVPEPDPVPEPEPEVEIVLEPEPVPEPEPEVEIVLEPEMLSEPDAETVSLVEEGSVAVEIKEEEEVVGLESTPMPTRVCAGCGESFHPEFMQEIDSKLYCGVCQLRSAALDARKQSPKFGSEKLRGMLAAFLLLGLLALVVLALKMLGII
jgi:hypothetical protein